MPSLDFLGTCFAVGVCILDAEAFLWKRRLMGGLMRCKRADFSKAVWDTGFLQEKVKEYIWETGGTRRP